MSSLPTALITPEGERFDCIAKFHRERTTKRWSGYVVHRGQFWKDLGDFDTIQEVEAAGKQATGGSNQVLVPHTETLESPGKDIINE